MKTKSFTSLGVTCTTVDEREDLFRSSVPSVLDHLTPKLRAIGFFEAPASTKYHGDHVGGLFDHSFTVATELVELTKKLNLKWARSASPWIVGILHDLCKCDLYAWDGEKYVYKNDSILSGHGDKSVILAQSLTSLTEEEIACIRWHMGAFEKDPTMWTYYTNAIHKFSNVLYTHTADMIAAHIKQI